MELETLDLDHCICGHCLEIHYDGPIWPGRYICLVDGCACVDFKRILDCIW
jgi:hypothetical protein